jgi:cell division protein FtsA
MTISTASVEPLTIVKLETELKEKHFSKDRELLHCVPLAYRLDQRPWTSSPVGFSGHEITGQFMLIEADKLYLADVVKLLNECGLEVLSLAAEPYASSIVTTGEEFKKLGSVIIDIGGGTTDGMIFQAGKPIKLFTINIGGKLMTNDLAIGLGVSIEEAEKIKIRFGLRTNQSELKLQVKNLRGQSKIISWQDVYPILAPRISELADLVHDEIKPYLSGLGAGLVVTGGGSEVMGICDFIGLHLPMSAKKAFPELQQAIRTIKANNQLKPQLSTKYATVVGLLALETIKQHEGRKHQKSSWTSRYVDLFVNWLKDLS